MKRSTRINTRVAPGGPVAQWLIAVAFIQEGWMEHSRGLGRNLKCRRIALFKK